MQLRVTITGAFSNPESSIVLISLLNTKFWWNPRCGGGNSCVGDSACAKCPLSTQPSLTMQTALSSFPFLWKNRSAPTGSLDYQRTITITLVSSSTVNTISLTPVQLIFLPMQLHTLWCNIQDRIIVPLVEILLSASDCVFSRSGGARARKSIQPCRAMPFWHEENKQKYLRRKRKVHIIISSFNSIRTVSLSIPMMPIRIKLRLHFFPLNPLSTTFSSFFPPAATF